MNALRNLRNSAFAALAVVGLLSLIGCGGVNDEGLPKRYPVSGTVKYKGELLSSGTINFLGQGGDRGASGEIKDGSYTLTAVSQGDGAVPGNYKVTVECIEVDMAPVIAHAKALAAKQGMPYNESMIDHQAAAKARANAKSKIPTRYAKATTSGLTVEVKAQSNTIPIELTD
jgi:hypothetical protein